MRCAVAAVGIVVLALAAGGGARAAEETPVRVSGSVFSGEKPLVGAEVRWVEVTFHGSRQEVAATTSDTEGVFSLTVPHRGGPFGLAGLLIVQASGFAPAVIDGGIQLLGSRPGGALSIGGRELTRGCIVTGKVVGRDGDASRPLAGARVVLWHERFDRPWETETDRDGRFVVRHLIAGEYVAGVAQLARGAPGCGFSAP